MKSKKQLRTENIVLTNKQKALCMFNEAAVAIYPWVESLWVATGTGRYGGYRYMFMNKISMSQPCLYNFFYQKATKTTSRYRRHLATCYSTQSSDSRRMVDGVQIQTSTSVCLLRCTQNVLYDITAGPHEG